MRSGDEEISSWRARETRRRRRRRSRRRRRRRNRGFATGCDP
jgi:hypothetical protein